MRRWQLHFRIWWCFSESRWWSSRHRVRWQRLAHGVWETAGCCTQWDDYEGWIVEAYVAPVAVHPRSVDRFGGRAACTYLHFHMLGTTMFPNYSTNLIPLRWLPLLEDFDACGAMPWGSTVLAFLYRELYKVETVQIIQFRGYSTLLQVISVKHFIYVSII